MKPFSISCTTCGARLKVRDERAIGELSLCPKCGSMVMVTPPAPGGEAAGGARAATSSGSSPQLIVGGGLNGSNFDDAAALLADTMDDVPAASPSSSNAKVKTEATPTAPDAMPASETATSQSAIRSSHSTSPPPPPIAPPTDSMSSIELDPREAAAQSSSPLARAGATATATVEREPVARADAKPSSGGETATSLSPAPLNPHSAFRIPQSETWQRYGMIAAAVVAAVGLVTGLLMLVWPQPKPSPVAVADGNVNLQPMAVADVVESEIADEVDPHLLADETTTKPPVPPTDDDLNVEPRPAAVDDAAPPTDGTSPTNDAAAPPLFVGPDDAGDPQPPAATGDDVATADTGLGDLVPFIDAFPLPPEPPPSAKPNEGEDGGDLRPDRVAVVVRERPEPRTIDIDARLADKIDGIDAGGAPLAKFVELISELSTIPISLDPAALAQVKARPNSPVSLTMTDATVADVLSAGLATYRLSYALRGEQIVVIAAPRSRERLLSANYEVEDLAADEAAMKELIEHVHALVEPSSWNAAGGAGTLKGETGKLVARNTQDAHFALHVFLQKLRVARGLKPRSSFDPALFALTTRTENAQAKLNTPVRAVFHAERPLTKILGHLEKAAGVSILIDWQSLLAAGWPTTSTTTLIADDVPLEEALNELLAPMELGYRAIDETTIQINSKQALSTQPELEFYPVTAEADPAKLIADVQEKVGKDRFDADGELFAVRYDDRSKCLLVLLPQMQQRLIEPSLHR